MELKAVKSAFHFLPAHEQPPIVYKEIPCHIIFDVKMDFSWKACFVAGGHKTDLPSSLTYSSVVSRNSIRIAFLLATLSDLDDLAADISNAYINTNVWDQVYFIAGDKFGPSNKGRVVVIVKALYGLKSSGAAWRAHLAQVLHDLGYKSSLADPNVWYRAEVKLDGFHYYAYILVYVDDILVISHDATKTMKALATQFCLKDGLARLHAILEQWSKSGDYLEMEQLDTGDIVRRNTWNKPSLMWKKSSWSMVKHSMGVIVPPCLQGIDLNWITPLF